MDIFDKSEHQVKQRKYEEHTSTLKQGKKLCFNRINLIRLAERDDWVTANTYESDEIASDFEDEKRIRRAKRSEAIARKSCNVRKGKSYQQQQQTTDNPSDKRNNAKPRFKMEEVICWKCGKKGHLIC